MAVDFAKFIAMLILAGFFLNLVKTWSINHGHGRLAGALEFVTP